MCVIIDTDTMSDVFNYNGPDAGKKLFHWFNTGPGRLVIGGSIMRKEFTNKEAQQWVYRGIDLGRVQEVNDQEVDALMKKLKKQGLCKSNDEHVIALAQLSHARLLCTQDQNLMQDFKNKNLIDDPRGKVYQTREENNRHRSFGYSHKKLLKEKCLPR